VEKRKNTAVGGGIGGGGGDVASAIVFSVLQAGWQILVSAKFVGAVALVCRLLTVTTFSGLSPARVVTPLFSWSSPNLVHLFVQWYSFHLIFSRCHMDAGSCSLYRSSFVGLTDFFFSS
jgi:hypothetical protein